MPPYHTVSGRSIKIFLDVEDDPDDDYTVEGNPFAELLTQIAKEWTDIANDKDLKLTFVPGPNTVLLPPTSPSPPGTVLVGNALPTDRILYMNSVEAPPTGVAFFKINIGTGARANATSRSARISYVEYETGNGYIYALKELSEHQRVPHISHELGHILGLADRYYEAICWSATHVLKRSCKQIRRDEWLDEDGKDQRLPVSLSSAPRGSPYFAERTSLLMHKNALPKDAQDQPLDGEYDPQDNLMSSNSPTLTTYQLEKVGINATGTPAKEADLRTINWVAILGNCQTGYKEYHAWDEGDGLLFYPSNDETKPIDHYPCRSRGRRARDENGVVGAAIIAQLTKKRWIWTFPFQKLYNRVKNPLLEILNPMCYARRLLRDLL